MSQNLKIDYLNEKLSINGNGECFVSRQKRMKSSYSILKEDENYKFNSSIKILKIIHFIFRNVKF